MISSFSPTIKVDEIFPFLGELIIPIIMTLNLTDADDDLSITSNKLIGNYPNPFNPTTTISFTIAQTSSFASLEIYNLKGQKVKSFPVILGGVEGQHSIVWNGKDDNNQPVSSGIYLYKMKTDNHEETKRMILLK